MKEFINNLRHLWDWIRHQLGPAEAVILLLLAILILSGCSSQQSGIKVIQQEVEIPVMIKCVHSKDVPKYDEYVTIKISRTDSDYVKVKKLIMKDYEHQKYAKVVDVLLNKCSQD